MACGNSASRLDKRLAFPSPKYGTYLIPLRTNYMYHIPLVTRPQGSVHSVGTYIVCLLRKDTLHRGANTKFVGTIIIRIHYLNVSSTYYNSKFQ